MKKKKRGGGREYVSRVIFLLVASLIFFLMFSTGNNGNPFDKTGFWFIEKGEYFDNEAYVSNIAESELHYRITGTKISFLTQRRDDYGLLHVFIDGKAQLVDLYSPETEYNVSILLAENLQDIEHEVVFRVTGGRNPNSRGSFVVVDEVFSDAMPLAAPQNEAPKQEESQFQQQTTLNNTDFSNSDFFETTETIPPPPDAGAQPTTYYQQPTNSTVQLPAEINNPVVWKKTVQSDTLSIEIPSAKNITVKKIIGESVEEIDDRDILIKKGRSTFSLDSYEQIYNPGEENVTVLVADYADAYEVTYETPPPIVSEHATTATTKEVSISSEYAYTNIVTYTLLPQEAPEAAVLLYHLVNGSKVPYTDKITYIDENNNSLIDKIEWIVPHLSNQTYEVEIVILNVNSYPVVGGEWVVDFTATGNANLTITPVNGTAFGRDILFSALSCNEQSISVSASDNQIFVENYSCSQKSREVSTVVTGGVHALEFRFGDAVAYAYNNASSSNSHSNLSIWDDTDIVSNGNNVKYPQTSVSFFASWTNKTTGASINNSGAYCRIGFPTLSNNNFFVNMSFDGSDSRYKYNRTLETSGIFTYNVTCIGRSISIANISALDNVTINKSFTTSYTNRTYVINSPVLTTTPTIDGNPCTDAACATSTEWRDNLKNHRSIVDIDDGTVGVMQVRVKHNNRSLYVFVDFIVDTSNQVDDYVNVVLDTKNNGGAAPDRDDFRFERSAGSNPTTKVFQGNGSAWLEITSSIKNFSASHKNGASPVVSSNHLTFEFNISLVEINASVTDTMGFMVHGFGQPSAGGNTYWPPIAVKKDGSDYDVPGFNYTAASGGTGDKIDTRPDRWATLVPNMVIPDTYPLVVTENNMTITELHFVNYSDEYVLRVLSSVNGTAWKTSISRVVANSDKSLGANHNKSTQVFPGDVIDILAKDDERMLRSRLFITRHMVLYNKSDMQYNLTTSTAASPLCSLTSNGSVSSSISCTMGNDDMNATVTYLVNNGNTHFSDFFLSQNTANVNLTAPSMYIYYDYDITKASGSETQDDYYAIVQSPDNSTVLEQINKEGKVVCDAVGAPNEIDLTKCSNTNNDTYYIRQSKGTGEAGGEILIAGATKLVAATALQVFIGFTNPTTDTDNKSEIPPEQIDVTQTGLMNKADLTTALRIILGTLIPGQKVQKYFGVSTGTTTTNLIDAINEPVKGSLIALRQGDPIVVKNGTLDQVIAFGAYFPVNMYYVVFNTGFLDISVNSTCNITAPDNSLVLKGSYLYNITAAEGGVTNYCGGSTKDEVFAFNTDNTLLPGSYSYLLNARAFITTDTSQFDEANRNFTILSDYVGNITLNVDNNLKFCNETVNMTINVTNIGNTNFTGNLTVDMYYNDPYNSPLTYYKNLRNGSYSVVKNGFNLTYIERNITECPLNRTYTIMANFTVHDETNGTEYRSATNFYTFHHWSNYYGRVAGNVTFEDAFNNSLFQWLVTNNTGLVYAADIDSSITWTSLFPLGIKNDSSAATNDFNEADDVLGINETRDDSIADFYSTNGGTAKNRTSFKAFGRILNNVSITESINKTAFSTGILWDAADSTNSEFDHSDKEDIVFVTEIRSNATGSMSILTDYELRVPYRLMGYKGAANTVALYLELR